MNLPLAARKIKFLNRDLPLFWILVPAVILLVLFLSFSFVYSLSEKAPSDISDAEKNPMASEPSEEVPSPIGDGFVELVKESTGSAQEARRGGNGCPIIPEGYRLKGDDSSEYSKTSEAPWGGKVQAVKGHLEGSEIVPEIEILPGEYIFFGEKSSIDGKGGGSVFLGKTTSLLEWLRGYSPTPKGSFFVTVFDIPPGKEDVEGNLREHPGIRGWVSLILEKER